MSKKPVKTTPLGVILQERNASIELHKFLLGDFEKDQPPTIPVGNRTFNVRIISLNPAPPIEGIAGGEKPEPDW